MRVITTDLPGVLVIEPRVFGDARGYFLESWQQRRYAEHGMVEGFVQDNQSYSRRGVLRGMHIQHPHAQGKLIAVLVGEVFDAVVDVRRGSPWFSRWTGAVLSGDTKRQLWVPPGFAHGFYVLSNEALFSYKCTDYYHAEHEFSVRWDDPAIGIEWPLSGPVVLSAKDRAAPILSAIPPERLPEYPAP